MADAKLIRTYAPAGVTANFVGITGDSHTPRWVATDLIKSMLEKNVMVFEQLKEADSDNKIETILTLDNYNTNNGGVELQDSDTATVCIVKDLEAERYSELKEIEEKHLAEKGLQMAAKMAEVYKVESDTTVPGTIVDENTEDLGD